LVKKYLVPNVHEVAISDQVFVFSNFSMRNVSRMDGHIIYYLTVVHLFKCIFNLGARAVHMLLAPRHLNPALSRLLSIRLNNAIPS